MTGLGFTTKPAKLVYLLANLAMIATHVSPGGRPGAGISRASLLLLLLFVPGSAEKPEKGPDSDEASSCDPEASFDIRPDGDVGGCIWVVVSQSVAVLVSR
jgi:hypothetical protein